MAKTFALAGPLVLMVLLALNPAQAQSAPQSSGAPSFLLGSPGLPADATRTITIAPDTRWVNGMQGETLRFVIGGAEFTWRFDGPPGRIVDLQQVAPPGLVTRSIPVYLTRPPGLGSARS